MSKYLEDARPEILETQRVEGPIHRPISYRRTVLNATTFQGAWLDLLWLNSGISLLLIGFLAVQLWWSFKANFKHLLLPLSILFVVGMGFDSLFGFWGFYRFPEPPVWGGVIPAWLLQLWFAFVLTLPISFAWLLVKPLLAVCIFSCLAPVSYLAGRQLGVIEFSDTTLVFISMAWALVVCLSCRILGKHVINQYEAFFEKKQIRGESDGKDRS